MAISNAISLAEVFDALELMLEFEEFAYAKLQLGQPGRAVAGERAFKALEERRPSQQIDFINGRIVWCWKRHGVDEEEVVGSSDYWCFRLPLSAASGDWGWINLYRPLDGPPLLLDLNYLSGFLRGQLSEAAERVISSFEESPSPSNVRLTMTAGKIAS
jgi:hypothetical protein